MGITFSLHCIIGDIFVILIYYILIYYILIYYILIY